MYKSNGQVGKTWFAAKQRYDTYLFIVRNMPLFVVMCTLYVQVQRECKPFSLITHQRCVATYTIGGNGDTAAGVP